MGADPEYEYKQVAPGAMDRFAGRWLCLGWIPREGRKACRKKTRGPTLDGSKYPSGDREIQMVSLQDTIRVMKKNIK